MNDFNRCTTELLITGDIPVQSIKFKPSRYKKLGEDRETYRKYRQNINEKSKLRSETKDLFFRIRRFVRTFGHD